MNSVVRVLPDSVTALWPQLDALLAPALAQTSTHTSEDVRRAIMAGRAQLWCEIESIKVLSACTTEFVDYPQGLFVRVWHAGSRPDHKLSAQAYLDLMTAWAKSHKAVGFEAIGRMGWLRKFPMARVEGLIMRQVFDPVESE